MIEYFNGRVYVFRDNEIWFSDPMALGRTDERRNFKQFQSRITMLSATGALIVRKEEGFYQYLVCVA